MATKARYTEVPEPLPSGVVDRWVTLPQAARLSQRTPPQLYIDLERGRLRGRRLPGPVRWGQSAWQIRLSELSRYVRTMGTSCGPRPRKPTELDWELLPTFPPPEGSGEHAA